MTPNSPIFSGGCYYTAETGNSSRVVDQHRERNPMKLKLAIVALVTCLLCAVNSTVTAEPVGSGVKTDIEFAKVGDASLTLDAFVPEGVGPFPTCILVHGGGFVRGDK